MKRAWNLDAGGDTLRPYYRPTAVLAWLVLLFSMFSHITAFAQVAVLTSRYDNGRTGANLGERYLSTSNVNVNQFGKLFSFPVSGSVYAQPLYVPGVNVAGFGTRNVLYVATMNDMLYAFDADSNAGPGGGTLWAVDLAAAVGGTPVPMTSIIPPGPANITGNVGIESTPVIDPATQTLYLLARTIENGAFVQRLHAIDITSGAEKFGGPVVIQGAVGAVAFDPKIQNQRPALALAAGRVIVAWGSHEDMFSWHGWVMAYDAMTLQQTGILCTTPSGSGGGVWQAGRGPVVDSAGFVYFAVGNGTTDLGSNLSEALLKIDPHNGLAVVDYFMPSRYSIFNSTDMDFGSSGPLLLPGTSMLISGGKEGYMYEVDTNNLGRYQNGDPQALAAFRANAGGSIMGGPVVWGRAAASGGPALYLWGNNDGLSSYGFSGNTLNTTPTSKFNSILPQFPGGMLALSANGSDPATGIVWALVSAGLDADADVVPGVLRAFDASNLGRELWNSTMNAARDDFGNLAKYSQPTVANGRVYLGTFSDQVFVYGLLAATPDFVLGASPAQATVAAGSSAAFSLGATPSAGFGGSVAWSASGLPPGASVAFSPASVTPPGTSAVTISTSAITPPGTSVITFTGTSGGIVHVASVQLVVTSPGGACAGAGALMGSQAVQSGQDSNTAGLAEAFSVAAAACGTAGSLTVYVDQGSNSPTLVAGLYADRGGHPGALLSQGSLSAPVAGNWNTVPIAPVSIAAGTRYWIAILGGSGGTLRFRDQPGSQTCAAETIAATGLSSLPASWTTGAVYTDCPLSAYVSATGASAPVVSSVGTTPASVTGGASATGTVSLSAPAQVATTVTLSSSSPSVVVPGSVSVAAGQTSATFTIATLVVSTGTSATISATAGGITRSATLGVTATPPSLSALGVAPVAVTGGTGATGTVSLSGAAAAATTVMLTSSNAAASVPASVAIPAGQSGATFAVATAAVATATTVTLSATAGGVTRTAVLTVQPSVAGCTGAAPAVLMGSQAVEAAADSNAGGTAEAFAAVAQGCGSAVSMTIYVDAGSTAGSLAAGVYADAGGHPGTLLAQGTLVAPKAAAWNKVVIPGTTISTGKTYWIAILGVNGTLRFRDRAAGACKSETAAQVNLTTLPSTWTTGALYTDCPVSGYVGSQ